MGSFKRLFKVKPREWMKQGCRKKKKITNSLTPKIAVWPLNHTDIYNCWNQSTNSSFSLDLRKTLCQKSVRTTWLLITTPKRTQCFFKSRSHLVRPITLLTRLNKMVWFTETLAILKDRCKTESRSNSETSDTHVPRPPPFQWTSTPPALERSKVYWSLSYLTNTPGQRGNSHETLP